MRITSIVFLMFFAVSSYAKTLLIYVGVTSKPPVQKLIAIYHKRTGSEINAVYGGSGTLLSQMILTKKGDIYMPASPDFMKLAERESVVFKGNIKKIAYLVPSLIVPRDNPKNIHSYKDLAKPGIKIVIANPETVPIGVYTAEIIDKSLNKTERLKIRENIINYAGSAAKTAAAVILHQADAAFEWKVYSYWRPELIKAININKFIRRISYISAGISSFTKNRKEALRFLNFLSSETSKKMFERYHIMTNLHEVYKSINKKVIAGGSYKLPENWLTE
ncbi:MAG: molybdate ABC transporter substrate-binding protein [Epsilonproteobacteria bacterium]|nr:molybdate ABC transporter substrate-binding protein [Campylobacterota bacterium]